MREKDASVTETTGSSTPTSRSKRLQSAQNSGMECSIFRFNNVNFVVGNSKDKEKLVLQDVSGTVKWGHVLAVMGSSGAGKTVLINALTLDAFYGKSYGSVTLNGVPLTDRIFKEHCYVVEQRDKHFPYLTCRETLRFAAELYDVTAKEDLDTVVDEIIDKMGLLICADIRNALLSGGQARRLSIGIALLKQPTLLFLDEPTSGLDAAAAENIMQEIVRVAKDERIVILCTIHQPSTKVYDGFDEVMILSKGREAFTGEVADATSYFEQVGYPLPLQTNPAEHFLDLVNADFSDDAEVDKILDTWEEMKPDSGSSHHKKGFDDDQGQNGVTQLKRAPLRKEISIMFRRSIALIIRDPILYVGRSIVFLIANTIFALVYLKARKYDQTQALNKMWINIWHVGVASNLGVVAVYALNDEFKTIVREAKNGMIGPLTYALAKTILVLPIMFIFAIFALGIPSIVIMDFPGYAFGKVVLLWSMVMYNFECLSECLSVWVDDPIMGMLVFMMYWFGFFLFSGFLIAEQDLIWPFRAFYYIMPFSYYLRSTMYAYLIDTTWNECDPSNNYENSAVCVTPPTGANVLGGIHLAYPVIEAKDTFADDIGVIIAVSLFFKFFYVIGVYVKTSKSAKIYPNSDYQKVAASNPAADHRGRTNVPRTVKYVLNDGEEVTDYQPAVATVSADGYSDLKPLDEARLEI